MNPEGPARPPPLPPQRPVEAVPLAYARPVGLSRPAAPPARFAIMGWLSMAFGIFSVVGNVIGIWLTWGWLPHPRRPAAVASAPIVTAVTPPPPPPPKVEPFMGDLFGPRGLSEPDRQRVVSFVSSHSQIDPSGRNDLDAMLAERGRDWLKLAEGQAVTGAQIRDLNLLHDWPRPQPGWPLVKQGAITVRAPGGTIDIRRHDVMFSPAGGRPVKMNGPKFVDEDGHQWWTYTMLAWKARSVQRYTKGKATAIQLGAFVADERGTSLDIRPEQSVGETGTVFPDGFLRVDADWPNVLDIDPQGRVQRMNGGDASHNIVAPVVRPAITARAPPKPPPTLSMTEIWLLILECLLSIPIAFALMGTGRLLTQRSTRAVRWAHWYAYPRIALNLAGVALGVLTGAATYTKLGLPVPDPFVLIAGNVIGLLLACAWPLLMLWATSGPVARSHLVNAA